mmetsp:Transcript_41590/g.118113  ORF Transcript_41590/g.118113 Transcript_41590/m.118113 type:complete len:81 (+) Transcript_41590:552-794(+)
MGFSFSRFPTLLLTDWLIDCCERAAQLVWRSSIAPSCVWVRGDEWLKRGCLYRHRRQTCFGPDRPRPPHERAGMPTPVFM